MAEACDYCGRYLGHAGPKWRRRYGSCPSCGKLMLADYDQVFPETITGKLDQTCWQVGSKVTVPNPLVGAEREEGVILKIELHKNEQEFCAEIRFAFDSRGHYPLRFLKMAKQEKQHGVD